MIFKFAVESLERNVQNKTKQNYCLLFSLLFDSNHIASINLYVVLEGLPTPRRESYFRVSFGNKYTLCLTLWIKFFLFPVGHNLALKHVKV